MECHAWTLADWLEWEGPQRRVCVEESGEETGREMIASAPPAAGYWIQGLLES